MVELYTRMRSMTQRHHLGSGWLEPIWNQEPKPAGTIAIPEAARREDSTSCTSRHRSRCVWRGAKRYVTSTVQAIGGGSR
jgi:hypothetical protein